MLDKNESLDVIQTHLPDEYWVVDSLHDCDSCSGSCDPTSWSLDLKGIAAELLHLRHLVKVLEEGDKDVRQCAKALVEALNK